MSDINVIVRNRVNEIIFFLCLFIMVDCENVFFFFGFDVLRDWVNLIGGRERESYGILMIDRWEREKRREELLMGKKFEVIVRFWS